MKRKQLGYYNIPGPGAFIVFGCVIGGAIMAVLFLLLPWLWGYVKPLLHALTA